MMPGIADILTYEKKILIRSEQVDMTRKLRISELFRLMEEASIAHTEELGCTREKTLDRGLLWVITRQQAEIDELPAYDEEITVRSWQGDMMHVFFPRFYEIERAGKVLIRGQALWILIDEADRQMIMPEDYDIEIPGRPGSDDMMLAPIVMPKGFSEAAAGSNDKSRAAEVSCGGRDLTFSDAEQGLIIKEDLETRFSQVDINGHMNNTRYFDIIDDAMHAFCTRGASGEISDEGEALTGSADVNRTSAESTDENRASDESVDEGEVSEGASCVAETAVWKKTPHLIRANYLSELRAGDRFTLAGYRDENDKVFFEGADGDKIKFRVVYEF